MELTNFHTHTTFCDGKHPPEEIILTAIEKGFSAIGFSEHSYIPFDLESGMSRESTELYKEAVCALKEKYKGKIDIFLGTEQDIFSPAPTDGYDYIIGSVHYVEANGEYITVDWKREHLIDGINKHFGGDIYAFCEKYYESVGNVADKTNCTIIGHFDLVSKFNEKNDLFDENDPRYIEAALGAVEKLIPKKRLFEINTGAISRGYRTKPYPAPFILKHIAELGGEVILSSDSHHKDTIDYAFEDAARYAAACGIKNIRTRF